MRCVEKNESKRGLNLRSRRDFLKLSGAVAAGASLGCSSVTSGRVRSGTTDTKPNIVFIIVDDMGYAGLGCYGQDAYKTPHIDRMAAEGIRFTDGYSGCTVCAPARSTLMTGLHMGHTPVRGNSGGISLPGDVVTTADVLVKAGYICGGFGKWGLGDLGTPGVPEKQGFSEFVGYYHQVHAHFYYPDYLIDTGKKMPLPGNKDFYSNNKGLGGMPVEKDGLKHEFTHDIIFERMVKFIRANKDRPFFCYAPWTPPHARYAMPENNPAWQAVKDKPWPTNTKGHAAFNIMMDTCVGKVLALLKELGLDEKTIVFFCSDNGASSRHEGTLDSSGPLTGHKRSMYEGGIRVPFIMRWPGKIEPGQVSHLPIYFPDMMPTFAELAGAETCVPAGIDGLSIAPTLLGKRGKQKVHEFMYWESNSSENPPQQAVRYGKWKSVRKYDKKKKSYEPWELYDLTRDIAEKNNIAAKRPEIVNKIEAWVKANRNDPPEQIEPQAPDGKRYR